MARLPRLNLPSISQHVIQCGSNEQVSILARVKVFIERKRIGLGSDIEFLDKNKQPGVNLCH